MLGFFSVIFFPVLAFLLSSSLKGPSASYQPLTLTAPAAFSGPSENRAGKDLVRVPWFLASLIALVLHLWSKYILGWMLLISSLHLDMSRNQRTPVSDPEGAFEIILFQTHHLTDEETWSRKCCHTSQPLWGIPWIVFLLPLVACVFCLS